MTKTPLPDEPAWPGSDDRPTVVLIDASSKVEYQLIVDWVERTATGPYETMRIPPSRRRRRLVRQDPRLEVRLGRGDDPLVLPVRVMWQAPERDGTRTVRLVDLLKLGDPRDPDALRQRAILAVSPDRCSIVLGEPAGADELRTAWRASTETTALRDFVARRAWLALERAERAMRGNRYKVPRFLHEEILHSGEFKDGVARLADEVGRSYESVHREAGRNLREIAATHSPFVIDILANGIHWLYHQGYGSLNYNRRRLHDLYALGQDHPLVFVPSHRSQLDRLVLQYMLWENNLPPNHTAGGINLNFFPIGPLLRRTGVFFIRRSFKDKPVYKYTLRSYIDFLVEKRFPLEWYLEGGRSRSGKLLPPKFGMLSYVADSLRRGKADDVMLLPISIAYDQIQDVADYAREQRGEAKESESFTWLLKAIRSLRRRYGNIHIRFGEPISMAKALPLDHDADEHSIALRKLAFDAMVHIGRVTPITPTSAVSLALLSRPTEALTVSEIIDELRELTTYVYRRRFPITEKVRLDGVDQVREVLDRLVEHDIVTRFAGDPARYRIGEDQHLAAAYYRNVIIHFFVTGAIAQLALDAASDASDDPTTAFWDHVMELRDLFKFEFFFAPKQEFRAEVERELSLHDRAWEATVADGKAREVLTTMRPLTAPWVLRPFVEAYLVVADELVDSPPDLDASDLISRALTRGRAYLAAGQIAAAESVSQAFFKAATELAENRGLLGSDRLGADLDLHRTAWAEELRSALASLNRISRLKGT